MATHSSIEHEKSHGQTSQVGYSPWVHKESDTTEHTRNIVNFKTVEITSKINILKLLKQILPVDSLSIRGYSSSIAFTDGSSIRVSMFLDKVERPVEFCCC